MIRINLLAVERERTKRRALIPAAHRLTVAASLVLLAAALFVAWKFWSLRQESAKVDEDIAQAQVQVQQLRSVLVQVRQFEASKAALEQRVTLIEQLRRVQSAPVHVIDEVSKAVPQYLWLTELSQTGSVFTISGMTTSLSGLSDFVANLEASAWFKRPVDIIDSQIDPSQKASEPIVKFSIRAVFEQPGAPTAPAAPPPAAGAGRGGPGTAASRP